MGGMGGGAWKMNWRNDADSGTLLCSFDVVEEVRRNEASIPQGRLFVTFPVWTQETLKELRRRKSEAEERHWAAIDRIQDIVSKMEDESSTLGQARHLGDFYWARK